MAQIIDLFRDATKNKASNEIYGNDASRIESRGLVNVPRKVALAASSPNSVADLIGSQVNGVLLGSANRPSDTIFKDNKPFSKPITILNGIPIGAKEANDRIEPGKQYFVKQSPTPQSLLGTIKQGPSSPINAVANVGIDALRNPTGAIKKAKEIAKGLKKAGNDEKTYGPQFIKTENGDVINSTKKFSEYAPVYGLPNEYSPTFSGFFSKLKDIYDNKFEQIKTVQRNKNNNWDIINNRILNYGNKFYPKESELSDELLDSKTTYVIIQLYGDSSSKIILPSTITGLSEDLSPEWQSFRYVGSPFMQHRYIGVERSIKFDLKLYYNDSATKEIMINNIEKLKLLTFPSEELSVIQYGDNKYNPLAFLPNLIHFSITGLYKNLLGFIEELSFQIDDNVSWASTDVDTTKSNPHLEMNGVKTAPYPSVIDVSIGIKIIPQIEIDKSRNTLVFNLNKGNQNRGAVIVGDAARDLATEKKENQK